MNLDRAMELVKELKEKYDDLDIGLNRCNEDDYEITLCSADDYEEEGNQRKVSDSLFNLIKK